MKSFREYADETINEKEFKDYFEEFMKLYNSLSTKDIARLEKETGLNPTPSESKLKVMKDRRFQMSDKDIKFEAKVQYYDVDENETRDAGFNVFLSKNGKIWVDWSGAGW